MSLNEDFRFMLQRRGGRFGLRACRRAFVGGGTLRVSPTEAFTDCSTGAQQTDADRSFRPPLLFRNLLNLETFQVVALKHHAVVVLTGFQDASDVNCRQIDFGAG